MKSKVIVVTGALGALGKVVAETALARGAKVAGIDHVGLGGDFDGITSVVVDSVAIL